MLVYHECGLFKNMGNVGKYIKMCNKRKISIIFVLCVTVQAGLLMYNKLKQIINNSETRPVIGKYGNSIFTECAILPWLRNIIIF